MRIAYFVHDLHDAAVARRIALLEWAGHAVVAIGFRRGDAVEAIRPASCAVDLGRTRDGKLAVRVLLVLRHWLSRGRVRHAARGADVLLARNLEVLVLAAAVRRPEQRLVYECLDIHRLLLGKGIASGALHRVERAALRGVDLLVTSSPDFLERYFRPQGFRGHGLLIENKVPALSGPMPVARQRRSGPPWVIGWFGMLRCRRSFAVLKSLVEAAQGRIEVLVAGKPSPAEFDDLAGVIAATPGMRFAGSYTAQDLPALYGSVHFSWTIDFFEEGLNSAWLLPNRLYESLAFGAVPIALRSVATGRWLARHGVGVLVDDPQAELLALLSRLDEHGYGVLHDAVELLPVDAVVMIPAEGRGTADAIVGRSG